MASRRPAPGGGPGQGDNCGGGIEQLIVRPPGVRQYEPMAAGNVIDIGSNSIDEGGFMADWTGNGPKAEDSPSETIYGFSGTMQGEFYGPEGEEIGGVLSGSS